NCRRLGRDSGVQAVSVSDGGGSKGIELVRSPEIGRELLHKLRRRIDPVETLERGGKRDLLESLQPVFMFLRGERVEIGEFPFQGFAFGRKLEIVLDGFPQQAGQEG